MTNTDELRADRDRLAEEVERLKKDYRDLHTLSSHKCPACAAKDRQIEAVRCLANELAYKLGYPEFEIGRKILAALVDDPPEEN